MLSGDPPPFDRLFASRLDDELVVAIHASVRGRLTEDESFVLGEAAKDGREWGLRTFSIGSAEPFAPGVPHASVVHESSDTGAYASVRWNGGDERGASLIDAAAITAWADASLPSASASMVVDTAMAERLGADAVVVTDKRLLALRDDQRLRHINLLSPLELGPVMGVWARATEAGGHFAHHADRSLYYWSLARALTPAAWPSYAALVYGRRVFPEGESLAALAESVLTRLDYLLRTLDQMAIAWEASADAARDHLEQEFDNVLLRVWAIHDTLARLVGTWFGVTGIDHRAWSLSKRDWRDAVRKRGGAEVLRAIDKTRPLIEASAEFRHHAAHRERLSHVRIHTATGRQASIRVTAPLSDEVRAQLASARQDPEAWGLSEPLPPHTVGHHAKVGDEMDEFETLDPGGVFVDPMLFSARLVAAVAELANDVFAALAPADDPRLPDKRRDLARARPRELWFAPEHGWHFAMTSPLAGLVDRIRP